MILFLKCINCKDWKFESKKIRMHQNGQLALVCFLVVFVLGQCRLSVDDNLEENHIEFYQNRKVLTTTPRPGRFSIFQKRTRPTFRRNNKHETLLTNYKIISNAADDGQINGKRLNKSRASVEFVNIHGSLNRQNTSQNTNQTSSQNDSLNSFDLKPASEVNSSTVNSNDSTDNYLNHNSSRANHIELTQTQQMILAFGHGLKVKREAKCELPKATVVYLNQDREQIKIYMPRATILYRCGQNTGCCERESDRCVAIEQKQVNLYFFVIKLEKEFNELDDNYESLKAARKARKFASFDTNDDGQLKEYEYNLDYTLNGENENSFRLPDNFEDAKMLNQLKSESSYLNTLLNEDNTIKRRLTRSTKSRRRSKDLKLGRCIMIRTFCQEI